MRNAFFFLFIIATLSTMAQEPLLLQNGTVTPDQNVGEDFELRYTANEVINDRVYRILQFNEIPDAATRTLLKGEGIELFEYLPQNAYYASITLSTPDAVFSEYDIGSIIEMDGFHKLHPDLYASSYPAWAMLDDQTIQLSVKYFDDVERSLAEGYLELEGATVTGHFEHTQRVLVQTNINNIDALVALSIVRYIEPIDPPAEPENLPGQTDIRSNTIALDRGLGRQYNGDGVNVAMGDDDMIGPHIDYEGRIDQSHVSGNTGNHGDHVAGTIMGAGNLDPTTQGMGWGTFLWVYHVWEAVEEISTSYFTENIRLTSTSYSNGCNAGYTSFAQDADQTSRDYPSLLHVFSAGNSGTDDCGYGAGAGWGNVTGGVKIGKNVIAVGNLSITDDLANSSSRGPAHDGRIKPDICAVGTNVYSTVDINTYEYKSGTSMSCPATSGTLSQLYDAYRDLNGGTDPDNTLMKATLLNTADDLGNVGPDFLHGWGRINALHAVELLEGNNYVKDSVDHGTNNNHVLNIPAGTEQVKLMVYWTDYEGAESAAIALVNDLDMVVTDPLAGTHLPWVLDTTATVAALSSPATNGTDHINNVEQVVIDNPTPGSYTININGFNVPQGPQSYYLVWQLVTKGITVTYPIGGESIVPGVTEYIRWDALGDTGTFDIEFSADNGTTWSPILMGVAGNLRYRVWTPPDTVSANCYVRVSRGALSDISDYPFGVIKVPQNITVNWVCPDSMNMSWDNLPEAAGYVVWRLGSMYMDSITYTADTTVTLFGGGWSNPKWVSVSAIGADGTFGRRALAIETPPALSNCSLPIDLELMEISTPGQGSHTDCTDLTQVPVSVWIRNIGQNPITNPQITYVLSPGGTVSETYTGTLNTGDSLLYTFSSPIDISSGGYFDIDIYVEALGDDFLYNDSAHVDFRATTGTLVTLPWQDDFELFPQCSEDNDCEDINCLLPWGWINEKNYVIDDIEWRSDTNGTPTINTGPNVDYNPGTVNGHYLYTEASGGCQLKEALLQTPCIDLTGAIAPQLRFMYFMFGNEMGEMHVDIKSNFGWDLDVIPPFIGNLGGPWQMAGVDLTPYAGEIIHVRWRGITGTGSRSDMAIDDVRVGEFSTINDASAPLNFFMYPNPAQESLTVQLATEATTIVITNMVGQQVQSVGIAPGNSSALLDLSELSNGIYFVTVLKAEGERATRKLVVTD